MTNLIPATGVIPAEQAALPMHQETHMSIIENYRQQLLENGFSAAAAEHVLKDLSKFNRLDTVDQQHVFELCIARCIQTKESFRLSTEWGLDPQATDGFGIPGVMRQGNPAENGWLPISQALAAIASENARFASTSIREIWAAGDEAPQYQGNNFWVIEHPEHGRMAVTAMEFGVLGLPEVELGGQEAFAENESPSP